MTKAEARVPSIIHVCQPTHGGAAIAVRQLTKVSLDEGYRVAVACPDGELSTWVREMGVEWIRLPLVRRPAWTDFKRLVEMRRLVRDVDVVHMHSSKAGAVGRLSTVLLRRRPFTIFSPHGWSWYVGGGLSRFYKIFERFAARLVDIVVVVSADEFRDGRLALGRHSARMRLIQNGVDTAEFTPDGPIADRSTGLLVVCVGRLCEQKGQDIAIRALARLTDANARLRLVGDGPDRTLLENLADELGVRGRVEFIGHTDPRPHLRASDMVVMPSRWEGMSLLLLEAMACGAAIISSRCGGSDALGDAGIVVPLGDHLALASAIEMMSSSPSRRSEFASHARRRAVEFYDIGRVHDQYSSLLKQALAVDSYKFPSM